MPVFTSQDVLSLLLLAVPSFAASFHDWSVRSGHDLDGNPFVLDADPASLRWSPKTISVVLPCAQDGVFAFNTVRSVFNSTPGDVLQEIIVVDDGSEPPLATTHFTDEVQARYKTKIVRHPETVGLISAKTSGGNIAKGDIIVFLDCHVAPQPNWHKSIIGLIGENWRRMVEPRITDLDIDTWTQRGGPHKVEEETWKCYLTWDADFKAYTSKDSFIPVINGGLLGMSRRWWRETGGYDSQMFGWGGENIDQSLRVWLCGGEIMQAKDSFVAHMWRKKDNRTKAQYKRVGNTAQNLARAMNAWYGDFAAKASEFPKFQGHVSPVREEGGHPWYGNLDNIFAVRDRLKCRSFAWFLRRFQDIYEQGGLIPENVFMIKDELSGKCLQYQGGIGTFYGYGDRKQTITLSDCSAKKEGIFWHAGNKDNTKDGRCCSGLRAWNTDNCMSHFHDRTLQSGVCDISGASPGQLWSLNAQGELRNGEQCLQVASDGEIEGIPCTGARKWVRASLHEPIETQVYKKALQDSPAAFTALEAMLAQRSTSMKVKKVKHSSESTGARAVTITASGIA